MFLHKPTTGQFPKATWRTISNIHATRMPSRVNDCYLTSSVQYLILVTKSTPFSFHWNIRPWEASVCFAIQHLEHKYIWDTCKYFWNKWIFSFAYYTDYSLDFSKLGLAKPHVVLPQVLFASFAYTLSPYLEWL